jgi:hypothetical protein
MTRQSEYPQVALDFVKAARYPQSAFEFAADLECVGMRGAKIPAARANVWKSVIDQLIAERKLIETEDGVRASPEAEPPKQMSLF